MNTVSPGSEAGAVAGLCGQNKLVATPVEGRKGRGATQGVENGSYKLLGVR